MAHKMPRTNRSGGKLALFEVLQAAGGDADSPPPSPAEVGDRRSRPASPPAPERGPRVGDATLQPNPMHAANSPTHNAIGPLGRARAAEAHRHGGLLSLSADPSSGRLGLSASYGGAALLAAAGVGVVGLGFLLGRVTGGGGDAPQVASATMPEVMDVTPASLANVAPPAARLAQTDTAVAATDTPLPSARPSDPAGADGPRVGGRNYVLVQSYHKSELDRAEATVAALRAAGVGATIERDIPGWSTRLCVFGTRGFERITQNPEYQAYVGKLLEVSRRHERDSLIKRFKPQAVRWDR